MAFRNLNMRCFKANHQKEYSKLCLNNIITLYYCYTTYSHLWGTTSVILLERWIWYWVMGSEFVLNSGMLLEFFLFLLTYFLDVTEKNPPFHIKQHPFLVYIISQWIGPPFVVEKQILTCSDEKGIKYIPLFEACKQMILY